MLAYNNVVSEISKINVLVVDRKRETRHRGAK